MEDFCGQTRFGVRITCECVIYTVNYCAIYLYGRFLNAKEVWGAYYMGVCHIRSLLLYYIPVWKVSVDDPGWRSSVLAPDQGPSC